MVRSQKVSESTRPGLTCDFSPLNAIYHRRQPIPVCLTRKDLKRELERAINSTYMHQNRGTCTWVLSHIPPPPAYPIPFIDYRSVKIGTLTQTPAQILDNIKSALPAVAQTIKGGWDNIQSFYIKTHSSVSLPVWACNLDDSDGGRWSGLTKDGDNVPGTTSESDGSTSSPSDDDEDEEATAVQPPAQAFGKKRGTAEQDEPPQKKAKTAHATAPTPPEKSIQSHRSVTKMKTNTATPAGKLKVDSAGKNVAGPSSGLSSAKVIGDSSVVKNTKQHSPQSPLALDGPKQKTIPAVRANRESEIGKKRMGLVEQKKMKLLKRKPDRSAKNAVIGRKPGQR